MAGYVSKEALDLIKQNQTKPGAIPETLPLGAAVASHVISVGEERRHRSALERFGIPLGLAGLAAAIGSRTGQAPEAAAATLSGYLQGAQSAAQMAREMELERAKLAAGQMQEQNLNLRTIASGLTGPSQAAVYGQLAANAGINPAGLSIPNPAYEARSREDAAALDAQYKVFLEGIKTKEAAPEAWAGLSTTLGKMGYGAAAENAGRISTLLKQTDDPDLRDKLLSFIATTTLGRNLARGENAAKLAAMPVDFLEGIAKAGVQSESNLASQKPQASGATGPWTLPGGDANERAAQANAIVSAPAGTYPPEQIGIAKSYLSFYEANQTTRSRAIYESAQKAVDQRAARMFTEFSIANRTDPIFLQWKALPAKDRPGFEAQMKSQWLDEEIRQATYGANAARQAIIDGGDSPVGGLKWNR